MKQLGKIGFSWFSLLILSGFLLTSSISFAETDVSDKIEIQKSRLRYDRRAQTSSLDIILKNISEENLLSPVKLFIFDITHSSVTLKSPDGTEDGKAYFLYSGLNAGESSTPRKIIFGNPSRARFNYSTSVSGIIEEQTPPDTDGDGTPDDQDGCPNDENKIEPGACGCGVPDMDADNDGTADCNDNCPDDPSKIEPGVCGCGVADADSDSDGTADCNDNCPNDPAKTNPGICGCGVEDIDTDGDGTPDCNDNCPNDSNKTEPGACGCGVENLDTDADGAMDCNDNCPNTPNGETVNAVGCSASQIDSDNDGVVDSEDACPGHDDSIDVDADSIPDGCDDLIDSDGDGVADSEDRCPGRDDTLDDDGDGVPNCVDFCPDTPSGEEVNSDGCSETQYTSEEIGPDGGVIETESGIKVEISPDALTSLETITVTQIPEFFYGNEALDPSHQLLSPVDFSPDGLIFENPVNVTFPLSVYVAPGTGLPIYTYDNTEQRFIDSGSSCVVNEDGTSCTGEISHFSTHTAVIDGLMNNTWKIDNRYPKLRNDQLSESESNPYIGEYAYFSYYGDHRLPNDTRNNDNYSYRVIVESDGPSEIINYFPPKELATVLLCSKSESEIASKAQDKK